jgi:hypothetical protein
MTIDVLPLLSVVAADVYVPLLSVIVPVGVGLLPPPLTVSATVNDCAVVMLVRDGVTVTVGVAFDGGGGGVELPPPPHDAIQKLATMLSQNPACLPVSFIVRLFRFTRAEILSFIPTLRGTER